MQEFVPGFRFYPTEEELISFYLHNKLQGTSQHLNRAMDRVIPTLHFYDFNPWDLPQLAGEMCREDPEQWFFYNPRQKREVHGGKPKRVTSSGYWKSTGSPCCVYSSNNRCIGLKRTMVFYNGRVPNGQKTDWKMNDYKAILPESSSSSTTSNPMVRHEYSLCRVYKASNKTRRAFDRRPAGVEIREAMAEAVRSEEVIVSHENPPLTVDPIAESSNPRPSQAEDINISMDIGNEPLWDWDQLYNWCMCDNGQDHI